MPPNKLILIVAGAALAAGLTIWALTSWGVPPIYILVAAMAGSIAVRLWSRRS